MKVIVEAELGLMESRLDGWKFLQIWGVRGALQGRFLRLRETLCCSEMLEFSSGKDKTEKVGFTFYHDCGYPWW